MTNDSGNALYNSQPLKFGLFSLNCSNHVIASEVPTGFEMTWEHNLAIAEMADRIGFEVIVPVARWRGFGGKINWLGENFETLTYAAGLAARTKNIAVAATVHAPLINPVVAAKAITTIDHISGGRAVLNVVMSWYPEEMAMLGIGLREHEDRYAYGEEWLEIVDRLWSDRGSFDYTGTYFNLIDCQAEPKPIQKRPVVINAGGSPRGTHFSARNADFNFTSFASYEQASGYAKNIRSIASEEYGRAIGLLTSATVICRETQAEADAVYQSILDNADVVAAQNFMSALNINSRGFAEHMKDGFERKMCISSGGPAFVGTPRHVAEQFRQLKDAGVDVVFLGFVDYLKEMPFFEAEVMPILKEMGLRH